MELAQDHTKMADFGIYGVEPLCGLNSAGSRSVPMMDFRWWNHSFPKKGGNFFKNWVTMHLSRSLCTMELMNFI